MTQRRGMRIIIKDRPAIAHGAGKLTLPVRVDTESFHVTVMVEVGVLAAGGPRDRLNRAVVVPEGGEYA